MKQSFNYMRIGNRHLDATIEQFLSSAPRYRLVVILAHDDGGSERVLNIGRELAKAIEPMKRSPEVHFLFAVQEAVSKIIREHTFVDPTFGECVVIANPGILFEPELGIDVTELLRRVSKNTLTILLWPGEASEQRLWLLREPSPYHINYSEINYIIL